MDQDLPLNWQTDPLYFDPQSLPTSHWLNANDLIEQKRKKEIFLNETTSLNLFPIMVRRSDFLRNDTSDRILARFPYIQLTEKEKKIISDQELLISEKLRNYFYKSDNRKILDWRTILQKDLKRGYVPLPFLRCFPRELKIEFSTRKFESSRGEAFKMPITLTKELAYLSGMVNGDGSLKKYVLNIVDYSIENIQQLKEQFQELFYQNGRIQLQTENSPTLIITNLWVVRLFSFLTGQPIGGKKYQDLCEPLLFQEQPFRSYYWSGVMDADGSYLQRNIILTSTSKSFSQEFISFLNSLNIHSKLYERADGTFQVYIPRKYHDIYKSEMKCLHPDKRKEFLKLEKGREKSSTKASLFVQFDNKKISNGLFDFSYLSDVQIIGLGLMLRNLRNDVSQTLFAQQLGINPQYLSQLERNTCSISISLLMKLLSLKNKQLMPFLLLHNHQIKYRKMNAPPVTLNLKPSTELVLFARKMIFYPTSIRIASNDKNLIRQIATNFGIEIENNLITNGVIRYFFRVFSIQKKQS